MDLIASYVVGSEGANSATLETPTFTPEAGELIVVKCGNEDDDDPALTGVFGGGLNWIRKAAVTIGNGNFSDAWIYTAEVVISEPMAVASTWSGAEAPGYHGMIVERWIGTTVANTPATNSVKTGAGAPASPIATTQQGSAITWVDVDWNSVSGTPAARGVDGEIVREYSPGGTYLPPFVRARTTGASAADATSHNVAPPAGRSAGDLLVVFFSSDAATAATLSAVSTLDGWQVLGTLPNGTAVRQTILWKVASGLDPLTVETAVAEQATWVALSVANGDTIEGALAATTGTVATTPVVRSTSTGAGSGAASFSVTKPAGLGVGDYLLAVQTADADTTSLSQSSGFSSLATSANSAGTNLPPVTIWGKVATSADVAAATFTFAQAGNTNGGGAVVIAAIQAGTYTGAPTFGSWTTQTRGTSGTGVTTMTASGLTGVANGLLMTAFNADSNGNAQTFPASNASGQTLVAQQQSPDRYSMIGLYRQALTAAGATGTESVTPSGTNTSNGFATVGFMFAPGSTSGGGGTSGGGTTTTPTTATVAARTVGGADTAALSHTVALPAGVVAGEAALVLFGNDTATATASTASSGWQVLGTQAQGTTTNHRGTVFYAADAATAATLVVSLSAAEEASWAAFRISGAATATPAIASANGSAATSFTAPAHDTLTSGNYTALLLVAVDSSTDTSLNQTVTWPASWTNTQTRRPASAGSSAAPEVFTAERRYTSVTAVQPGTVSLSLSEQWIAFTVVFADGSITTGGGGGTAGTGTPPQVSATGGTLQRLWLSALTLDTDPAAAAGQTLTPPGGFGTVTRRDGAGLASTLTATAETLSTSVTVTPSPWEWSSYEEFVASTVAVTGGTGGGGGNLRMYAGVNYDSTLPQPAGPRTIGMTAPGAQAWTLLGIELLPAPVSALLDYIEEIEEPQDLVAARSFAVVAVDEVEELPPLEVYKLVAGPLLTAPEEVEELPGLEVFKQLPPLGAIEELEDFDTPITLSRLVLLPGPIEEVEEPQDLFAGGTALGVVTVVEEVPGLGVGFGGIDTAKSLPRRGLPPVVYRGGVRFLAQNIVSGAWLHRELPVEAPQLTRTLSGPQVITGQFGTEIEDLRDLNLEPWGTWVHMEEAGEIRGSGILLPGTVSADGVLELEARGPSSYVARVPYTGEARYIQADPAEIVRTLWAHAQSFPRGNLGVEVVGSTGHRVGTPESSQVRDMDVVARREAARYIIQKYDASPSSVVFEDLTYPGAPEVVLARNDELLALYADESGEYPFVIDWLRHYYSTAQEMVTVAGKPWELHGYELPMIGRVIDQLGEEAPFEWVEDQGWVDGNKEQVWHRIRIGAPRVGSRLDLNLTQGENLLEHAPFEEPDDAYADSAFVQGRGEGQDAIAGYAGVDVPYRLRLPRVVTDKTLSSQAAATARAHEEVAAALATVEQIAEIAVNVRHENSLWGTFDVGDEVLPRIRLPWLGTFAQWHRITQLTYAPDQGYAALQLSRRDAFRSR